MRKLSRRDMVNIFIENLVPSIPGLYQKAISGIYKIKADLPADREEKLSLVVLASGYLANITNIKRNYCDKGLGEFNDLWSAYVEVYILKYPKFFNSDWKMIVENDTELQEIISKTSFPERTKIALFGIDYKEFWSL